MPTSVYFNNQGATREQMLIEDMIIESIKNHGIDIYYLPRESQSTFDELFGDDPVKSYSKAFKIDMYLESFNDFEGNQEFFSKFGLEIQKSARVAVARRTFERYVPTSLRNVPKEGDLIYLPVQEKILEIKRVEEEKNFFQAGKQAPYMFGLYIETFKYNGELFTTGIEDIDDIADVRAFGIEYSMQAGGTGTYTKDEVVFQGSTLATSTARGYVSNWNVLTRKLRLRNIRGEFTGNTVVKGQSTNAQWSTIVGTPANTMEDILSEIDDNVRVETEADNILDWTETNPFGMPNE
jgi:hypothetical protein